MSKRVLVVDDDILIVRMIEFKLKGGGFEVICAFDGKEAMEKVLESEPDLCYW
jgi:two-component system response regulator VicR